MHISTEGKKIAYVEAMCINCLGESPERDCCEKWNIGFYKMEVFSTREPTISYSRTHFCGDHLLYTTLYKSGPGQQLAMCWMVWESKSQWHLDFYTHPDWPSGPHSLLYKG